MRCRCRTEGKPLTPGWRIGVGLAVALVGWSAAASPLWGQVGREGSAGVVTLSGVVRSRFGDEVRPLPLAAVEARTRQGVRRAVSDSVGRYEIVGLTPGDVDVVASHVGHASVRLTVRLPQEGEVVVDLELAAEPVPIAGVDVRTDGREVPGDVEPSEPPPAELEPDPELEVHLLDVGPTLAEAGMIEAIQSLPGNDPADPTDVLFMRGSTTDMKLVLLDGVPVYAPFHVGGILRSFEPAMLGSAQFLVGGAPARYDGGLTHILDLRTRTARRDRFRASGSVDLLTASAAAEIPLGDRVGALVSARTLHDLGAAPLGGDRPYGYGDLMVTLDAAAARDHRVRATGFWNQEAVRLDFPSAPANASWGNHALSLGYEGRMGGADVRVTTGASRYAADLPLRPTPTPDVPNPFDILASARTERVRVVAESAWGDASSPVRAGLSFEDLQAAFSAENLGGTSRTRGRGGRSVVGSFVDVTRPLEPGVSVRVGLRTDLFEGDAPRVSPRVSLAWEVAPDALLTVAAGRYHQVTRTPTSGELDQTLETFAEQGLDGSELLPVASADHVVLTLGQRLGASTSLGLGGYWKQYTGLDAGGGDPIRNSGIDLQVVSGGSETTVWLGYGLSWFWSTQDLSGRATDFVGRHLLSAGASGTLAGPLHAEARVAYGAGLPSTGIPFGSLEAADAGASLGPADQLSGDGGPALRDDSFLLDESFLRLDLELHALFEPRWGGHPWRIRPYLRLLNALDRRDALFYTYQPWRSHEVTPLAERPILPLFGVSFAF